MVLDLKKVFLGNERLVSDFSFDMTDAPAEMAFATPVTGKLTVTNHAGMVVFEAEACFEGHLFCDRCCEPFDRSYAYRFSHILVVTPSEGEDDDYIEAPDYMLDTDALLRDDILLELPSKFLCKDSCKGLCPKCGKNLNQGECSCNKREPDPRLAALSALLEE